MGWESSLADAKKGHRPYLKNWSRDKFATDRAADFESLLARIYREEGMPGKHRRIAVESSATLTPADFVRRYEEPELPVLLTGTTEAWPAQYRWTLDRLKDDFRDRRFKCGEDDDGYKIKVTMRNFVKYMRHNADDSPLYIFDSTFDDDDSAKRLLDDYRVPKYFPTNPDQVGVGAEGGVSTLHFILLLFLLLLLLLLLLATVPRAPLYFSSLSPENNQESARTYERYVVYEERMLPFPSLTGGPPDDGSRASECGGRREGGSTGRRRRSPAAAAVAGYSARQRRRLPRLVFARGGAAAATVPLAAPGPEAERNVRAHGPLGHLGLEHGGARQKALGALSARHPKSRGQGQAAGRGRWVGVAGLKKNTRESSKRSRLSIKCAR
jgi:hypothetical protein